MNGQVEFGVRLPVAGPLASAEAVARVSRAAERLGFDAVWVHDFLVWTKLQDELHISCGSLEAVEAAQARPGYAPLFLESLISLAYVAGLTERIRIGVAVLCLPFRNPILAAKQVATLDVLSQGRLILGVGVGAPKTAKNQDFEVLGVPRGDKYRRTADYLKAMIAIWTQEHPAYEGDFVRFPPTELNPKPVQKPFPPLWFGGMGPKTVELTAEFGTGWLPGGWSPEEFRTHIAQLREVAAAKGRPDLDFAIGIETVACVAPTQEEALRTSQRTLNVLPEAFAAVDSLEQVLTSSLVGSTEAVRERVRAFADAGVRHFELKFVYHSIEHLLEQMALWSEEIMPAFRDDAARRPEPSVVAV